MKKRFRRSDPKREQYWHEVVRRHRRSGQSVREYCRSAGVKEGTFYWWRRELARRRRERKPVREASSGPSDRGQARRSPRGRRRPGRPRARFLPVQVVSRGMAEGPSGVEIHLAGGRIVEVRPGFDRQTLRDVLAVLEGLPEIAGHRPGTLDAGSRRGVEEACRC